METKMKLCYLESKGNKQRWTAHKEGRQLKPNRIRNINFCFIICYTNGGFGRPFFLFVTKSHDAPTLCLAKFNFPNI